MKNLVKITTTIILAVAMVVAFSGVVNADSVLFNNNNNTTNNTTNEVTNNATTNNTANTSGGGILNNTVNTPVNTPVNNTPVVNNTTETIPKTGENDIFIVAGVGAIALVMGAVAYKNSKKYSI